MISDENKQKDEMIRSVTKKDIPECVQVIKSSFQTVADEFGFTRENAPRFTAFAISEEKLLQQLEQEHRPMFVYEKDDHIAGYCSLSFQEDGSCELNNLCVSPMERHKQIGKKLLDFCFKYATNRSTSRITIGIVEENKVLRSWYEKNGFRHIGTKKFDFFPFTCGYMERKI